MPPNTDGIFPGETDYRALEDKLLDGADKSREIFSVAAANVFQAAPFEVLAAIVAGGQRLFIARARVTYAGHQFLTEDFRRMWAIIVRIHDARAPVHQRVHH